MDLETENIKSKAKWGCGCLGAVVLGIIFGLPHCDREVREIRVTGKESVARSIDDGHVYSVNMIYGTDVHSGKPVALENTWSLLEMKFSPNQLQAYFEVGENYRVSTYGWNFEPLGFYENITGAQKLDN